jgi:hypothetical protein
VTILTDEADVPERSIAVDELHLMVVIVAIDCEPLKGPVGFAADSV